MTFGVHERDLLGLFVLFGATVEGGPDRRYEGMPASSQKEKE
jgi:hypothetical protein